MDVSNGFIIIKKCLVPGNWRQSTLELLGVACPDDLIINCISGEPKRTKVNTDANKTEKLYLRNDIKRKYTPIKW